MDRAQETGSILRLVLAYGNSIQANWSGSLDGIVRRCGVLRRGQPEEPLVAEEVLVRPRLSNSARHFALLEFTWL